MSDLDASRAHRLGEWCGPGGQHLLVTIRRNSWRHLFRRTYEVHCWECHVVITDSGVTR